MRKIHVLTLTYNGINLLQKLRKGLADNLNYVTMEHGSIKQGWDYPEWYIRDNGSKDNTVEEVNSWKYESNILLSTTVFPINHNRDNFSQGVNYLFEKANPKDDDLILLLNNDVEFNDHESLNNMIDLLTENVGIVGARLLYPGTNKLQHAGVIFSERYGNMPYHYRHGEESDEIACQNRYFQAVTAACCIFRAIDFKRAGLLKTDLWWAFEDINFALTVNKEKRIAYCGKTNISHGESKTLKINPVNKMFLQHNVKTFKNAWFGKYRIDHNDYLNDPNFNLIK